MNHGSVLARYGVISERPIPWRSMLVTIALAGLAAFAGVRLGAGPARMQRVALSERIFELVGNEQQLTQQQKDAIRAIGAKYAPIRQRLQAQSRAENIQVLGLMASEQRFGPQTEASLDQLQVVMGERLKLSLEYMLEIRAQLTPAQRQDFERNLIQEASDAR
jgi:nickel and cobalt resistance protein CnrR